MQATLTEAQTRRELAGHVQVARGSWEFAQRWAAGLDLAELRTAYRLVIPGDAGLAVQQEYRRRRTCRAASRRDAGVR